MDCIVDCALRTLFANRKDLFGEKGLFLNFKSEPVFSNVDGYQSNAVFGRILYKNENGTTCMSSSPLMLKMTPKKAILVVYNKVEFINEIFFYTQLLPFFSALRDAGHLFPIYYNSMLNVNYDVFNGVIVLENLQAIGFTTSAGKSFLDYDHLALMMKKLGEFHAYSYRAKKTDPVRFSDLTRSFNDSSFLLFGDRSSGLSSLGLRGVDPLRNDSRYLSKVAELEDFMKSAASLMKRILCEDKANPLAVLCHGDYLRSNVLFKYDQGKPVDLKIIDMASCKLTSPVYDLAHILYINADQTMRDRHWDDLIDEYYSALKRTFPNIEVPTQDSLMAEFRCKASFVYFVAAYFLTWLIAADNNLPSIREFLPTEYEDVDLCIMPSEPWINASLALAGDLGTEALADILKDMIDRGIL